MGFDLSLGRAAHVSNAADRGPCARMIALSFVLAVCATAADTWSPKGAMTTAGRYPATLLPNGKVLVAGGFNLGYLASAELFDPASGNWSATASMATKRAGPTATLLLDGKVLVFGGYDGSNTHAIAELFTPEPPIVPPALAITHTGPTTAIISWPSPSTGWSLEGNSILTGGIWTAPAESISDDSENKSIEVITTTGSRFFRLAP